MATQTETRGALEFLLSEANSSRSRSTGTIESGQTLKAGHVLGKVSASGEYKEYNPGNADGSETAVAVLADDVDASGSAVEATLIDRDAEVHAALLVWFDGATDAQKTTGEGELDAQSGIRVRH